MSAVESTEPSGTCECPICNEPLFLAYTALCGHALCPKCVKSHCNADNVISPQDSLLSRMSMAAGEVRVPRCPVCRAAVHETQYKRCYDLEKAAQALHPKEWNTPGAAKAVADFSMAHAESIDDLRVLKAVHDEQAIDAVVKLIWKAVRECLDNSTALLISGKITQPYVFHGPARLRMTDGGNIDLSEFAHADAVAEIESTLNTLWTHTEAIRTRLEAQRLALNTFRFRGDNYAVVTWPNLAASE